MINPKDCDESELDILGRSFLKELLPFIETYGYDGRSQFWDIIDSKTNHSDSQTSDASQFLFFYSRKQSIEALINSDIDINKLVSSFSIDEDLVLIKIPSTTHGAAHYELNTILLDALRPMGLHKTIQGYPNTRIRSESAARGKQPDCGWGPRRPPRMPGRSTTKSPTVVLEVAYSESRRKLQSDIRYWLSPREGNAKVCLTMDIHRRDSTILVENWTRNANGRIYRAQHIEITRQDQTIVSGDWPLRVPFESLFLREIDRSSPRERENINISKAKLIELASTIWEAEDV
ncbi:hypothetical protein N7478_002795 [Penicillium angulare]|uniref:uncharacterized protein n=1 Tax=Penicillium angulare TaxID=116970 RepID=UPI0025422935|nr:uncharacterized protein N7478_002795 [Penicillium angulare]KAJ5287109.1 hypothetical protein N7478_002795 [Penicillium angulare]